jgi:membrane fusion protein, multidrug efflux system
MALEVGATWREYLGRLISIGILIGALILGITVLERTRFSPRTDDAEVLANFIGIAPQVEGPILHLNVHDNQFVKQGDLLFEIDRSALRVRSGESSLGPGCFRRPDRR